MQILFRRKFVKKIIDDEILQYLEKIKSADETLVAKAVARDFEAVLEKKLLELGYEIADRLKRSSDKHKRVVVQSLRQKEFVDAKEVKFDRQKLVNEIVKAQNVVMPILHLHKEVAQELDNKLFMTFFESMEKRIRQKAYIEDVFTLFLTSQA